jgi:hypothetical protein
VLGQVRDDQWELPGLGVWTVRSLAGHTARAILTDEAISTTLHLATTTASDHGDGETVLMALTGRAPLPEGFSVV